MPKPKPPPPAVLALQKAEAELPALRQRLQKLLGQSEEDELTSENEDVPTGEPSDGDAAADEEVNEAALESSGEELDEEGSDDEGSDEDLDIEDSDVEDSDEEYQYNHPLPRQDQVEIQGVCEVTEELIRETLTTYNKDAIDWIKDHLHCESHAG